MQIRTVTSLAITSVLVLAGCAGGQAAATASAPPPTAAPPAGATTIGVKLQEWAITIDAATAPAGEVVFKITNTGPDDVHEFVVLSTDLDMGALPVDATGKVSEDGGGIEAIDEVEDVAVGQSQDLKVTLKPGKYVLVCNIYDDKDKEAHYKMGMRVAFEVSG